MCRENVPRGRDKIFDTYFCGARTPEVWEGKKLAEFGAIQLYTLIANTSGMDRDVKNRKSK